MNFFNLKNLCFSCFLISVLTCFSLAQTTESGNLPNRQGAAKIVKTEFDENKTDASPVKSDNSAGLPLSVPADSTGKNAAAVNPPKVNPDTLRHLSLDNAIDLLTQNNLSVVAARYSVDLARAQTIIAGLRPSATVTVSATQFKFPYSFLHPQTFAPAIVATTPPPISATRLNTTA